MKKATAVLVLLALAGLSPLASAEVAVRDGASLSKNQIVQKADFDSKEHITSFCIEGHVFVRVIGSTTTNAGTGTGVALVQVYEERDGKVLPMRCTP